MGRGCDPWLLLCDRLLPALTGFFDSAGSINEAGERLHVHSHDSYVAWITREMRESPKRRRACEGPRGTEPRGPSPSAPTSGQRRCPGSGAGGLRRLLSVALSAPVRLGRRPGAFGARGWSRPLAVGQRMATRLCVRGLGGFLRIVLDGHGLRNRSTQPLCIFAFSAGRPRASPGPTVLLNDRAAVPCRPVTFLERGPTTHGTIRTPHRSSEPRVVLSGPPLAGTDTGTNEAVRGPVTRRTGEYRPELRYDRGTVRAGSWRGTSPACPAPPGSGRGSPSRGRGSPGARPR